MRTAAVVVFMLVLALPAAAAQPPRATLKLEAVAPLVVVGRGWADGVVELRNRFTGETREIPVDSAATDISTAVAAS